MLEKVKIKIEGTHCQSCKTLIETEVDILSGVKDIEVDFDTGITKLEFDDSSISMEKIIKTIKELNYSVVLSDENNNHKNENKSSFGKYPIRNIIIGIIVLIALAFSYYLVSELGLFEVLAKLNEENVSYGLIFIIGLLASFHCIGMCGGLVVAYSAKTKKLEKKKSMNLHWQYNIGRMISYSVIGAILGGFGSFFGINPIFTGVITLVAGVFMVLMGISLIKNIKLLEKIKLRTPKFIARYLFNQKYSDNPRGPFFIGLLNGFMPCGPLQAMQLYALTSGSVSRGALSMLLYAAGTVPLMFGFGNVITMLSHQRIAKIMKISGIIVIVLGLFMFNRGLTNFGYGFKNFIPSDQVVSSEYKVNGDITEYQVVNMELSFRGYEPNVLYIKKGIPVRWVINATQVSGCTNEIIIPKYNIKKEIVKGENIIEFVPEETGEINFSCWMQMVWGKFIVVKNDDELPGEKDIIVEPATDFPES